MRHPEAMETAEYDRKERGSCARPGMKYPSGLGR